MLIDTVLMPTRDLLSTAEYYASVLGLPVDRYSGGCDVAIGSSTVRLVEDTELSGAQHLALTIPRGSFDPAKAWLAERATLLSRDGVDEFEANPSWNARSVYFDGPDEQVLELIERRDLGEPRSGPFGPGSIVSVSEVGIAVPDVPAAVERLAAAGLRPYGDPPTAAFAAVGDATGLLVLVPPGRPWLPTADHRSAEQPLSVRADVARAVVLNANGALVEPGTASAHPAT